MKYRRKVLLPLVCAGMTLVVVYRFAGINSAVTLDKVNAEDKAEM